MISCNSSRIAGWKSLWPKGTRNAMKIITINTHSLEEPDYEKKLHQFAEVALAEQPDVFAMQEVNQSVSAEKRGLSRLPGYVGCPDFSGPVRQDNHAARLAELLSENGTKYFWSWVPAKLGYEKYDEGLALFCREPILEVDSFRISRCSDYENWKTRRILGVRTNAGWFYTVHMGWWDDDEEPFPEQWERLEGHLRPLMDIRKRTSLQTVSQWEKTAAACTESLPVWLMGDFNSLDSIAGQGYDLIRKSGWKDTYCLARKKDRGITVGKVIDGWRERLSEDPLGKKAEETDLDLSGMRIDYIWCSQNVPIAESLVICNGEKYPVVSDHYGVMIET